MSKIAAQVSLRCARPPLVRPRRRSRLSPSCAEPSVGRMFPHSDLWSECVGPEPSPRMFGQPASTAGCDPSVLAKVAEVSEPGARTRFCEKRASRVVRRATSPLRRRRHMAAMRAACDRSLVHARAQQTTLPALSLRQSDPSGSTSINEWVQTSASALVVGVGHREDQITKMAVKMISGEPSISGMFTVCHIPAGLARNEPGPAHSSTPNSSGGMHQGLTNDESGRPPRSRAARSAPARRQSHPPR